jgi:YHS domain-containing protein
MKTRMLLASFVAVAVAFTAAVSAEDEAKKLDGIKCPVSGQKVKEASAVDYKGGKVYFCCDNCPKGFAANTAKFATKANQQLVATGQAKQVKCPFTGGKINAETETDIAGTKVSFCCKMCKGKAEKATGDAQLTAVFGDAAFAKGFEVPKAEKK